MNLIKIIKNRNNILSINERNLDYIHRFNSRSAMKIADSKILTKKLLSANNIPASKVIKIIKNEEELRKFDFDSLPNSFVVKPNTGSQGNGIQIFYNKDKEGNYIKADGTRVTKEKLISLCKSILEGDYSLHDSPDKVIIEERVKLYKGFKYYSYKGAPDVRVILFKNIPVMSYIRIPTPESDGKANLAKGAIAAGIDLATGVTTYAVKGKGKIIENVPGTHLRLSGIKIPYWNKILRLSAEASIATGLGYVGVDFLIDKDLGPLIVEINARPGLSIQTANQDGLKRRLKKIHGMKVNNVDKAIRMAKDLFGGEIEEEIESISGKKVIGAFEPVSIYWGENKFPALSKVDTGREFSLIEKNLAQKIGVAEELINLAGKSGEINLEEINKKYNKEDFFEKVIYDKELSRNRVYIWLEIEMAETRISTRFEVSSKEEMKTNLLIGRNSLSKFLVDASKKSVTS